MAALGEGAKAPDFSLPALDGSKFSLQDALKHGQVLAVFFKISCPVCQYAFPFFERLHKTYGNQRVAMVAVSQDDKNNTAAFLKEYGVTFPALLDDPAATRLPMHTASPTFLHGSSSVRMARSKSPA